MNPIYHSKAYKWFKKYSGESLEINCYLAKILSFIKTCPVKQILNISDVSTWMNQDVREEDNFLTKSILCMPISNGQKTLIGVAQLINKVRVYVQYKQTPSIFWIQRAKILNGKNNLIFRLVSIRSRIRTFRYLKRSQFSAD